MGGGEDGKSPLFVPKGQVVQWSLFAMHRRKELFGEDAEEFKPERWTTLRTGWVRENSFLQAKHPFHAKNQLGADR